MGDDVNTGVRPVFYSEENTGQIYHNRVPTSRNRPRDNDSAPPLIFSSALQTVDTHSTSVKSQTGVAKQNPPGTPTVETPHRSIYIPPVSPSAPKDVLETDTQEKSSRLSLREESQTLQTSRQTPIIRMPVLIAQNDISIDISHTVEIPYPVQTMTSLSWRVHSLTCRILVLEKRLIVRGRLIPEIRYLTCNTPGEVRGFSTEIPWYESTSIEFTYPPLVPVAKETNVYTFVTDPSQYIVTHREQRDRHVDSPFADLRESYIVSSEQLTSEQTRSNVLLHVSATLSIDIFQMQLVSSNHF